MMQSILERITITGLHGNKKIDVNIRDNTIVLVGENGSGKTTFLRILFYILSGSWQSLVSYRFDTITISISGKVHVIPHQSLRKDFKKADRRFLAKLPPHMRKRIMDLIESGNVERIQMEMERMGAHYNFPPKLIADQLYLFEDSSRKLKKELQESIEEIRKAIDAQILYLPTYRRIERELSSIYEGIDTDDFRRFRNRILSRGMGDSYIELVEFGMKDVEKAIKDTLESLKEFARENLNKLTLGYLGDVLDQEYDKVSIKEIAETSEDTIRGVLNRIDESILSKHDKENLFSVINAVRSSIAFDERSKIVCHYFLKLLRFQESLQQRERRIAEFCMLCSEYIVDKDLHYDSANFSFTIASKYGDTSESNIELSELSSGEKQIVSLFSHLYLSGTKRYFVLIDEPELSLSVPWQRRFLTDIRKGDFCAGLVAATHSPFIYDNDLKKYAYALGEFVSREDAPR
jgi:predicted ATP-dependent endonuclease of OLD family